MKLNTIRRNRNSAFFSPFLLPFLATLCSHATHGQDTGAACKDSVNAEIVLIPADEFAMGGPSVEAIREVRLTNLPNRPCCSCLIKGVEDCSPKHQVSVRSFWMVDILDYTVVQIAYTYAEEYSKWACNRLLKWK